MILYTNRSAKSVACSRLNVIGVSAFFFLPVLVAAFTRADEFHSVTKTRWPSALSHFASSASCVVLPDPSMPSTTNSLPGYSCGRVRLVSMGIDGRVLLQAADFEPQRFAGHAFERGRVARRGPQLELGVAGGAQLQQVVVAAIVDVEAGDALRMAAIEALGEPQHRRQRADDAARAPRQIAEPLVLSFRRPLAVVARDQADGLDLLRLEAAQVAVLDQVVGVLVVSLVADMDADVVQDRRELEPLALAIGEAVDRPRLIEQRHRQPGDVVRVIRPVVAALGELDDAAAPDVGVAVDLRDLLPVAGDIVEDHALAQRQIAERDFRRPQPAQEFV